jgi:hypothetical protein
VALTYTTFVTSLANMIVWQTTDARFVTALPNIIDDAEQRIYRDLDMLNTVTRDASAALAAGNRNFNLPTASQTFIVVEDFNVITPAGTTNPESGTRNPLVPASKEVLDFLFPSSTGSAVPVYFAPITQNAWIVGPWPDQSYQLEVVGTFRPAPLSASNTTSLLSVYLPDLFLAAAAVIGAAAQKNFGAASDDPKLAVSWEAHYSTLLQSAQTEEMRKKFVAQGWSSKQPAPIATPART